MTPSSPASSLLPASAPAVRLLRPLQPADRAPLEAILRATGAFSAAEVAVALELIDAGLLAPAACGYSFVVAEEEGSVHGYACYGEAPMTDGVYDLYWIAVDPGRQRSGLGRRLLAAVEETVAARGGRMLLIETASKESYGATRGFYERAGYRELARVPDYYREGDDKVVYGRRLAGR